MTKNEKAISNLDMIRVAFINVNTKEQIKIINDTFNTAIEALKQADCNTCEVGNPCLYCIHEFKSQERSKDKS